MYYYSTNRQSPKADFRTATLLGQPTDKGLYFPAYIPAWTGAQIGELRQADKTEMGTQIMRPYVGDCIPFTELERIVRETLDFSIPVVPVNPPSVWSLELFHGPTLAFKDVGARFMSRCLGYFNAHNSRKVTVLVATSGDTGGAVANGFENVDGVEVIILYPSGKVSPVQELQLTTCAGNITALEVSGNFDDCQRMVKQAFTDSDLNEAYQLTSANSINIARWLPQQLYYCLALQQWPVEEPPPVICVPSGNFGNLCAGMLAWRSGWPADHFIAACNENDVVPRFLELGNYEPRPAVATISNAMDVGDPSNFVRILELFEQDVEYLRCMLTGYRVSDGETRQTIGEVYRQHGYLLDPHGAVGYAALQRYREEEPEAAGIFLETAHPVKFPETVEEATGKPVEVPERLRPLLEKPKRSIAMDASFTALKSWMMDRRP